MDCLNSWGFWEKRAELEIKIANLRPSSRTTRTVYLSCNFCGKSVSNALQEDARLRNVSSNVNKVTFMKDTISTFHIIILHGCRLPAFILP